MWKVERETHYFKIYDAKKNIVGYFAPEYGEIYPEEKADEIIEQMHQRHDQIKSGFLMVPMVKFGIFNEGQEMDLGYVIKQVDDVKTRLSYWADFLSSNGIKHYRVMVSHTDHDMLSITLHLEFSTPIELEKNALQEEVGKILTPLQSIGLL
ncbi:MAG: hypothetical protein KGI25_09110 [Thaumarchaeota archaeon]|nr:hypothetical protein [Nitrososphaerota archaeon]